jgi:ribosomal protein S24E
MQVYYIASHYDQKHFSIINNVTDHGRFIRVPYRTGFYLSTIVTLEDKTNGLLKRREVVCVFKGVAGKLTRKDAAEMLAKELKLDKKFVIPISLQPETGMSDLRCMFYVYDDDLAKRHLPKYILLRMLSKEERKKVKEAAKAKGKKPAEGAAEAALAETKEAPKESKEEKAEPKAEKPKKEAKKEEKPEGEAK